jgi:hypothetical protein
MPIVLQPAQSSIIIRKSTFEHARIHRSEVDSAFNLTDTEFHVEGQVIVIGPLPNEEVAGPIAEWLEKRGLVYFEDYFEFSGNWPEWLRLYVGSGR